MPCFAATLSTEGSDAAAAAHSAASFLKDGARARAEKEDTRRGAPLPPPPSGELP
jgi:hypothetical protein